MQLDTETAAAILKSSAQCNAVAEEATRRVVELMQEGIEYRARIAELEAALDDMLMAYDLPGNHCEMVQAAERARAIIEPKK